MASNVLQPAGAVLGPQPGLFDEQAALELVELKGTFDNFFSFSTSELVELEASLKNFCPSSTPAQEVKHGENASSSVIPRISPAYSVEDGDFTPTDTEDVDNFLREALQNKDRLTVLRLEEEVDKFMRNPKLQQLEFQPMPYSYLQVAAHQVAQHYNLQSSVFDSSTPEVPGKLLGRDQTAVFQGCDCLIQTDKSFEEKPVYVAPHKVEIKRRTLKGSKVGWDSVGSGDSASRLNALKSVQERKEEYSKARTRIFSGNDLAERVMAEEQWEVSRIWKDSLMVSADLRKKLEEVRETVRRVDLNDGLARNYNGKGERESPVRYKVNSNRVTIFRDRERVMAEEVSAVGSLENMEGLFDGISRFEEKLEEVRKTIRRVDLNDGLARTFNGKGEGESPFRYKVNPNKVTIFRDREDCKDPDYSCSCDR